jgi:uncharacterized protein
MPLTREDILAAIDSHADQLQRLGAQRLALFGSFARGEGTETSDIDLLVELNPTFDAYMDVKQHLEEMFGRSIDLVTAASIKPRLRPTILAEAVHGSRL